MPIEKRWFFRRAVAFVIDMTLVSLAVVVVALVLQSVTGISFRPPANFTSKSCQNVDLVSPETFDAFGEEFSQGEHLQILCRISNLGLITYYDTMIGIRLETENAVQQKFVHYASDAEGSPVQSVPLDWLVSLLAPLVFAFQLARKRSTFGKRILAIEAVTLDNSTPSLAAALRREFLKFSPVILWSIGGLVFAAFLGVGFGAGAETPEQMVRDMAPLIPEPFALLDWMVPSILLGLAFLAFYFGSFIVWRGQTFWDRFAGLKVTNL